MILLPQYKDVLRILSMSKMIRKRKKKKKKRENTKNGKKIEAIQKIKIKKGILRYVQIKKKHLQQNGLNFPRIIIN